MQCTRIRRIISAGGAVALAESGLLLFAPTSGAADHSLGRSLGQSHLTLRRTP
jgi:hypothetical protein